MNVLQKRAWMTVLIGLVASLAYIIMAVMINPTIAISALSVMAFAAFGVFIGRKEIVDERDKAIARYAAMGAGIMSYCAFIAGCMGVWFYKMLTEQDVVTIQVLPNLVVIGMVVFFVTHAIITLVMYGRNVEAGYEPH